MKGAWNLQDEIQYGKYMAILNEESKNQLEKKKVPFDTLGMHTAAVEAWKAAVKCDEYDQQPDAKGKVKIKYRATSQNRYKNFGITLVQAGQYFYQNRKDNKAAFEAWSLYIDMKKTSIFAEVQDFPKDPFYYDIAYYAALLSYQANDFANAEKYATLTAEDPTKAAEANEIMLFSKKQTMKTAEDSVAYLNMLKEFHKQNPQEERFFNLLMDYFNHANNPAATKQWLEEEIAANPQNKMVWALKGEGEMNNEKWNEAIEDYKKAIEIDPDFLQCVFNAGRCYYAMAMELQNKLADKNNMITNENRAKVAEIINQAKDFYVRARELDPSRSTCNWAYPLYQIAYWMKDEASMKELESVDPTLAQ
jgi:tetratricopeptide (TPR) repeat protein